MSTSSTTPFASLGLLALIAGMAACPTAPAADCRVDASACGAGDVCGDDGVCVVDPCVADPASCEPPDPGCVADPSLCSAGQVCLDDGTCADGCASDADCDSADAPRCVDGACVAAGDDCRVDASLCAAGEVCDADSGDCVIDCRVDASVCAVGEVCAADDGACVADCRVDASVCAADEVCATDGACVADCRVDPGVCTVNEACREDGRCAPDCRLDPALCGAGELCGVDGECESGCELDPSLCGAGEVCAADGGCVADCRVDPSSCAAGTVCSPDDGLCIGDCRADASLCGADDVCAADSGLCVADCRVDPAVCAADEACDPSSGACAADCVVDPAVCGVDEVCGAVRVCVTDCRVDPAVCAAGAACDPSSGVCAPDCLADPAVCDVDEVCGAGAVCVADCRVDPTVCAAAEACDPVRGVCAPDCVADPAVCDVDEVCGAAAVCVADCRVDPSACAGNEVCDASSGVCAADCRVDPSVCAADEACDPSSGACAADCAVDPAACGVDEVCGAARVCVVDCRADPAVCAVGDACDPASGVCAPDCVVDPAACSAGEVCGAARVCVVDCRADPAVCAAGDRCDPADGLCAADCIADPAACGAGEVCGPDAVCIADCNVDASVCAAGSEVCEPGSGRCVDDCRVVPFVCNAVTEDCRASDGLCEPDECEAADGEVVCAADCCAAGEVCRFDTCVPDPAACNSDDECDDDSRCVAGECIPFGAGGDTNPQCTVLVPIGVFTPAIQCEWQPPPSATPPVPCTQQLNGTPFPAGNASYPHGLRSLQCARRDVCVDPDLTDGSTARVCFDPHRQVLSTTTVINFAFPVGSRGNPGGFSGGRPSLVFSSYDALDGGNPAGTSNGVIRVVDGASCATLYTIDGTDAATGLPKFTMGASPLALGDIDLAPDGRPEIVAHAHGGGLWAFKYDETVDDFVVLWHSTNADGSLNQFNRGTRSVDAFGFELFNVQHWTGPALHDLDDDGFPEVMMSGAVFDADGRALFIPSAAFEADVRYVATGQFPALADVDLDGRPDFVTGDKVFGWVSAGAGQPGAWVLKPGYVLDAGLFDGTVAVGDFGSFTLRSGAADPGRPEVAVVNGQSFVASSEGRRLFGPFPIPGGGVGGPPTIGDFDGDGSAEYAEAGGRAYTVFDFECAVTPPTTACTLDSQCGAGLHCPPPGRCARSSTPCTANPDCSAGEACIVLSASRVCVPSECEGNGFRWSRISQDLSSNRSGSSIFDFEGDGNVEAVYSDECYTRVYDGGDGTVLFSQFHTSCTWHENPVVADVDGDLRSEIVIGSNENCATANTCFANAFTVSLGVDGVASNDDVRVDPIFPGLRCASDADCPGGGGCVDELCRCTSDAQCGGGDFVCSPVLAGSTSVTGQNVCRAAFRIDTADGRPGITGVRVYRDVADRWVGSRPIWNQHTYSITHVEDDGFLPASSAVAANWLDPELNNYRQNSPGALDPTAFPDLTATLAGECLDSDNLLFQLQAQVCNRGTADIGLGVPVSFYLGTAPDPASLLCTSVTTQNLAPAQCDTLTCDLNVPSFIARDYVVVADDDGTGSGERAECIEGNNSGFVTAGCF